MSNYPGIQFNNTFRGCEPADYNACVGNNGHPSYTEYANGYVDAAVHLINIAIEQQTMDELIYPICFNMRHAIELRLKQFVFVLQYIRNTTNLSDFHDTKLHDLGEIWRYYKNKASEVDRRITNKLLELESIITDFAEIDPTGQAFRYPYSTDKEKHLTNVSLINIVHLKQEFELLQSFLEDLHQLNNALATEYQTETYTDHLSRSDIESVSECLPPHTHWKSDIDSCLKIKTEIRSKYSITSNEFGRAKKIIESHYQFAKNIGLEIPLKNSNICDWLAIFKAYILMDEGRKAVSHNQANIISSSSIPFENIIDLSRRTHEATIHCLGHISAEAFIDIFCVYECGRHGKYCEDYGVIYNREIQLVRLHLLNADQRREYIRYLLQKNNFKRFAMRGLNMLRQEKILSVLEEKYGLEDL